MKAIIYLKNKKKIKFKWYERPLNTIETISKAMKDGEKIVHIEKQFTIQCDEIVAIKIKRNESEAEKFNAQLK